MGRGRSPSKSIDDQGNVKAAVTLEQIQRRGPDGRHQQCADRTRGGGSRQGAGLSRAAPRIHAGDVVPCAQARPGQSGSRSGPGLAGAGRAELPLLQGHEIGREGDLLEKMSVSQAELDLALSNAFNASLRRLPANRQMQFRWEQYYWLKRRDACANSYPVKDCVVDTYRVAARDHAGRANGAVASSPTRASLTARGRQRPLRL